MCPFDFWTFFVLFFKKGKVCEKQHYNGVLQSCRGPDLQIVLSR